MTSAGEIFIDVKGRDVSLESLLSRLETRMRQTDAAGQQLADVFGRTVPAGQQRAADAALRHAQALARLAQAQGSSAQGANLLRTALASNAGASDRATTAVLTQITNLERGRTIATQFGDATKNSLLGIIGPAAAVGVAFRALGQIDDLTRLGAQAEQTAARFDQLAKQSGTTGQAMTAALRQASAGTISDTNLQLDAMKASLLGVAKSADELAPLLAIARDRAQQMGISTEFAFDSLVTGLGRGSRLILDNIGIIVRESEVNEAYARSVGKTVAQLTDQEKKQALINEVLRQGNETLARTGGALETSATKVERFGATLENVKSRLGGLFANVLTPALEGANTLLTFGDRLAGLQDQIITSSTSFDEYAQKTSFANGQLANLGVQLNVLTPAQFAYAQSLIATGTAATDAATKALGLGDQTRQLNAIFDTANVSNQGAAAVLQEYSAAILQVASTSPQASDNVLALASAFANGQITAEQFRTVIEATIAAQQAQTQATANAAAMEQFRRGEQQAGIATTQAHTQALTTNAQALVDQLTKTQQSTFQGQQLTDVQATLANLGGAVAQGLQTAGSAALALANQYGIAYDQALKLINAQAQLAQAKLNTQALTDQRAGERDAGSGRTFQQIQFVADQERRAHASRLRRAEEAERGLRKTAAGGGGRAALRSAEA